MKKLVFATIAAAFLGGLVGRVLTEDPAPVFSSPQQKQTPHKQAPGDPPIGVRPERAPPELPVQGLTPDEQRNIAVYEGVNRGVVNITTRSARADFFLSEIPTEGAGSGSVLDKNGHILTNYHVIEGAREVHVTLFDGESYAAKIVGADPVNDMAVLLIEAPRASLFPVSIGDSSNLKVGQKVYAIGNPFGLERTMTVGIISSLNRSLAGRGARSMKSIIQIDAALNRGNSGGPLLDSSGRLIGMNTAIASRTGENTGVGFAIPVNTIRRVAPELITKGRIVRGDLGIAQVYQTEQGLVIASLTPGGAAERAGLRAFRVVRERSRQGDYIIEQRRIDRSYADRIVAIDGKQIETADELLTLVDEKKPGDRITVSVIREGKQVDVPVELGEE